MNQKSSAAIYCAAAVAAAVPGAAQAQADEPWKWEAAIYGYFPAIGGTTAFPAAAGGSTIDVSTGDVVDALKFAFMGQIEARKGKWGVWSDLVYADFGASRQGTRNFTVNHQPVSVDANIVLDVKTWIWSLAGIYNLESTPELNADLLFGARLLDMQQTLSWSLSNDIPALPGRSGTASVDLVNWDAIVGVKGRDHFGADHRWFLPYYLDIGTGESKFTWQINAGVGYRFDWGVDIRQLALPGLRLQVRQSSGKPRHERPGRRRGLPLVEAEFESDARKMP